MLSSEVRSVELAESVIASQLLSDTAASYSRSIEPPGVMMLTDAHRPLAVARSRVAATERSKFSYLAVYIDRSNAER